MAAVAVGMAAPQGGGGTLAAQAAAPCGLLMTAEIQPLAPKVTLPPGVATSLAGGVHACRYTWGEGARRVKLDVIVNDSAGMFAGAGADAIKQGLQSSVVAGTEDAVVADVGDAAVFKADSAVYVHATAYVKGRILQVLFDGFEAREEKGQIIALLKTAASRI